MRRNAQGVVLLVLGAGLLKLCVSGSYARYVPRGNAALLVFTAIGLMVLGAVALRQTMSALRTGEESTVDRPSRAGWPLLATAATALLLVPPPAGAYQASRTPVLAVGSSAVGALPTGDPVRLSVRDYVARATDHDGASLRDRHVTLSGFVVLAPDGRPYLARMSMGCCAADARPIEVGLTGNLPAGLGAGQWIEIDGGYVDLRDRDTTSQAIIPYVEVSAVRAIAQPANPYE
jgi:uncharacterized repeat protein (TIGR03943 family)